MTALATTGKLNDTVQSLAKLIGQDPTEWHKWLQPANPKDQSSYQIITIGAKERACGTFKIPNFILGVWAGWEGLCQGAAQFYVMWGKDVADLRAKGFAVAQIKNEKAAVILRMLHCYTGPKSRSLHGFLFWGHGGSDGLTTKESENNNPGLDYYLQHRRVNNPAKGLRYKLGFGMVYSCYGHHAKAHMMAPGAAFWGGPDLLVPLPFHLNAPTVGSVLSGKK